jgi:hypothetical protein
LAALRLVGDPLAEPEDVVGLLGAVQSQDFGPAKWSVGRRAKHAVDADLDRAYAEGRLLRTHLLRPTWHFVLPADIRWLLAATAPRIRARVASRHRQLGIDDDAVRRAGELLKAALRGGGRLTRKEAAGVLWAGGLDVDGQRLPHLLMGVELDALICSGPPQGKQHTYMLLEERAPQARELERAEALGELAVRYFLSHGPATEKDLAGWASLTLADVRAGLELAAPSLRHEVIAGTTFWSGHEERPAEKTDRPVVHLLQGYDEYVMGYSETRQALAPAAAPWRAAAPPVFALVVLLDGRLAGSWRRTIAKRGLTIQVALLAPLAADERRALEDEATRYARFLGLPSVDVSTTIRDV